MVTSRKSKSLFVAVMFCLLAAANVQSQSKSKPPKIIAYIIGTWVIQQANRPNDTSSVNYPREITFDVEGKYTKAGKNGEKTKGTYSVNENTSRIYLDAGYNAKPEEWNVRFKNSKMTLQAPLPSRTPYLYVRKEAVVPAQ